MQPQRETMTDRLADVIQVIHIGGRSGTLTVERGEDRKLEEGLITFINGRVAGARVNQRNGLVAFNYLSTWQLCRYAFIDYTNNYAPASPSSLSPGTFSNGANGGSATRSLSSQTTKLLDLSGRGNGAEYSYATNEQSFCPLRLRAGEELLLRPGNRYLSRLQRHLLLLINGQRSISDLARLLARNSNEVQALLDDLVRMDLIQL